jgi:hypothetical protein
VLITKTINNGAGKYKNLWILRDLSVKRQKFANPIFFEWENWRLRKKWSCNSIITNYQSNHEIANRVSDRLAVEIGWAAPRWPEAVIANLLLDPRMESANRAPWS